MTTEKMRPVFLDTPACKGCQACVELMPDVFGWDETAEKPYLKQEAAPENELGRCMAMCPARCIEAGEDEGNSNDKGKGKDASGGRGE